MGEPPPDSAPGALGEGAAASGVAVSLACVLDVVALGPVVLERVAEALADALVCRVAEGAVVVARGGVVVRGAAVVVLGAGAGGAAVLVDAGVGAAVLIGVGLGVGVGATAAGGATRGAAPESKRKPTTVPGAGLYEVSPLAL